MTNNRRIKKRYSLLIEIFIALTIVSLAAIPLIYPHVYMYREKLRFVNMIELDHAANLIYADISEKLYRGDISWESIEKKTIIPIEDSALAAYSNGRPLPFRGYYQLTVKLDKPRQPVDKSYLLLKLTLEFIPSHLALNASEEQKINERVLYTYLIFAERRL